MRTSATALSRDGVRFCSFDECSGEIFDKAAFIRGDAATDLGRSALHRSSSHDWPGSSGTESIYQGSESLSTSTSSCPYFLDMNFLRQFEC